MFVVPSSGTTNNMVYKGVIMVRLSAGEKKKKLIIDVCKKLFYRKGYTNTTYEDICKIADIPPGTITYHFSGKRDIAGVIEAEYEAHNKIYIEEMCGDYYSKTLLMIIENYHMWKRIFEDGNLRRFLLDISTERLPSFAASETVKHFYQCVIEDQKIASISDRELTFMVAAQLGMSDGLIGIISNDLENFTYEETAEFGIKFFLRQLGMSDKTITKLTEEGKEIFDALPIDNRYYTDFQYDEKYLTVLKEKA